MFTGIVTDLGRVRAIERRGDTRIVIATTYDTRTIDLGASIACSGCCLTVVAKDGGWFAIDASAETLARTTMGDWAIGTKVNLERSLRAGDEIGGHLVSGHVDAVARVVDRRAEGDSARFTFAIPGEFAHYIAPKGSVALDGVSLTVNEVDGAQFGVNIIPHTQRVTTFGDLAPGGRLNFEVDTLARYVARMMEGR
ncbi:MAG: riboflavin synthase [Alphaproteobacteria bacterium]|nr:riboflavin synthase [Alphaproteobacteria bacterium]